MSNTKEIFLTEEGVNEIKSRLDELKLVKRPEIINSLKEARAQGDLSENAEYDAARSEQAIIESEIMELEKTLENAKVIAKVKTDKVGLGVHVTLKYLVDNEEETYIIVGSHEVDPFTNKISNESPLAQAIMGLKVGAKVNVASPNGEYAVEIVDIY